MEMPEDSKQPEATRRSPKQPEPWLRGTHADLDAIARQIVHAFELTAEDAERWCAGLSDVEIDARPFAPSPFALPPVAFHLRHIARSLDRLLSYAEGTQLDASQLAALRSELEPGATRDAVFAELREGLKQATARVLGFSPEHYNTPRGVGRAGLPTTLGGLLVHCADHTQRHMGQAVTTAKVVIAMRG
jgi:uncharacterized damage-inducible protein DinB